ncbi:SCO family protein [Methylocella sp.]|uniref:SCO family protein n=1 Tax=Methylocella sp. TaxID=1978226 RepID=UPI003784E371
MTKASRSLLPILALLALGLVGFGVFAFRDLEKRGAGQSHAAIGAPFSLKTTDGAPFSDADLRGRPHLVFFGYTHCPDVCPTALAQMSATLAALGPDARIGGLFVSVDPARDDAKTLKDYLSSFDPRIVGLTGSEAQIRAAAKAFRAYYKLHEPDASGDYVVDHTGVVYLMDRNGRFVSAFNLDRPAGAAAAELRPYL